MTTEYSLDQIEAFDRAWTDAFAQGRGWEDHDLKDPVDDLTLFFDHLPGPTILDVGCGWGRYVYRFLDHGLRYLGIDHSVEMLKVARADNPEASFLLGSLRSLPFPDDQFDGLWSCCALSAIPKAHIEEVLHEQQRVLKPNGIMYIVMPAPPESSEMLYTDEKDNPTIYQAHYHIDEFVEHVEAAGFAVIESDFRLANGSFYVLAKKAHRANNH